MTAAIFPFPLIRRTHFISKQARRAAELSPAAGEKHITAQVKAQRDAMVRKGIAAGIIERETAQLESAIRAAVWSAVLMPPVGTA
jgi:hypothetical protein